MSNIVPQPQITFENNKIYIDSPVDVKYTLDGLDPVFYGVIYTSPISISHTTTIKAISVNSLGEYSNLVAGTFTPESDVSDGSSGSTWNPSYDDAVTLEELSAMSYATTSYVADYVAEHGGGEMPDLSSYVTKDELSAQSYITINDVPETDLSDYVTYDFLSSQSYLTSIPSEYITQTELSSNSYLTQHQDLSTYIASPSSLTYNGQISLFPNGLNINQYGQIHAGWYNYNQIKDQNYHWMSSGTTRNLIHGILADSSYLTSVPSEYITQQELSACGYATNTYVYNNYVKKGADITTSGAAIGNLRVEGELKVNANTYSYNIIPQENNTYTLGDGDHIWQNTYSTNFITYSNGNGFYNRAERQINVMLSYDWRYVFHQNYFGPASNNSRNLGDSSNKWKTTYTTDLYADNFYTYSLTRIYSTSNYNINFNLNGANRFSMDTLSFSPINDNTRNLGASTAKWAATYTANIYTENVSYTSGKSKILMNDRNVDIYTNNKKMINLSDYGGLVPQQTNVNLGGSSNQWSYTYTQNLILNGIDINDKFIPTEGGTITGRLESNYYTTANSEGGISSYSSVLVGADDRNSVTMLATRRLCGETSYAAAFFTNSDGRSKFTHKTKTTATTALGSNDDAFLCFNAYGFKLAYSGTPGTSATTEYEVLHTGNIGNLGYATTTELSSYLSLNGGDMTGNIDFGTSRAYITANSDGQWKNGWGYAPLKVMSYASANGSAWTPVFAVRDWGGNVWSAGVVNTREFIFSYQAVGNVGSNNTHTEWKISSSGDLSGAGRTFIHSSNYNNYNTTYTYNLAERLNTLFSFDSSTNTLTITTT